MSKASWHNSICKFYFLSSRETHTVWGFLRFLATWDCLPHLTPIECIGQPGHKQSATQCHSHADLTKTAQWFYFHFRLKPNQIYWIIYTYIYTCNNSTAAKAMKSWRVTNMYHHQHVLFQYFQCIHTNWLHANDTLFTAIILMTVITISAFGFLAKLWKGFWKPVFCNKGCPCEPMVRTGRWSWAKTFPKPARTSILSISFGPANENTKTKLPKTLFVLQTCFMKITGNIWWASNQ